MPEITQKPSTVLIDPPLNVLQGGGYGAINHYPLMTVEEVQKMPIGDLVTDNCHVWLWVYNATLRIGYDLLESWGFTPRSVFTWVKPRMGMGVYLRNCTEHLILATRGRAPILFKAQPNVGIFPVQDHSHKPEELYDIIERVSPGPYLELFARRKRHGWLSWGNEIDSDIVIPGYPVPTYSDKVTTTDEPKEV